MTAHKDLLPSFFDELEKIAGSGRDLAHLGFGLAGGAAIGSTAMHKHHRKLDREFVNRLEAHGVEMKRLPMEVFTGKGKEKVSKADEKITMMEGEKKIVLLSKQRGLPPLMVKMLKKTPMGVTVTIDPLYKKNDKSKVHTPNGFYTLKGDRIHVTTSDPHILAHEMGHAESDESLLGRVVQSRHLYPLIHLAPLTGLLSGVALGGLKHPMAKAIAIGAPFLMTVPAMAAEAKASINGHEILRQAGASDKELADYRKKMAKYYLTYARLPASTALTMLVGRLGG